MNERNNTPRETPSAPNREGGSFTIQFGTESVELALQAHPSVQDAFRNNAEYLGFDFDRRLTYRDNRNNILTGEEAPAAGVTYYASITHDSKGR